MTPHHPVPRFIAILFCFLVFAGSAIAQVPDVEIYWNENDRADTVIDFDVTLEGFAVTRTFTVVNRSNFPVTIPAKLEPYFIILNTPDVEPQHPRKEEFAAVDGEIPFVVPAASTKSFRLEFLAFKDNALFPPDIIAEALLFLKVVASSNQSGPGVSKVFRLRALKTTRPLASTIKTLAFDSVYINPNPVPTLKYSIRNVTPAEIAIDSQVTRQRTSLITNPPELRVDVHPVVVFAGRESVEWIARYTPADTGLDAISFSVYYKATDSTSADPIVVEISGVGVEQRLQIVSAVGAPATLKDVRDTSGGNIVVDFGEVPANGTSYVATIIVRNTGNLNLGYDDEINIGGERDTAALKIRTPWSGGRGRGARRGDFDTLVVTFTPTSSGEHRSAYVLTTDIKRRTIKGIPDGANTYTVYLRGFGERPQLQAPALIDFGTIVHLPGCPSVAERPLRIANVGNATLFVDSITIAQGIGTVNIGGTLNFAIGIGGSVELPVRYSTVAVGADSGVITLWTNALTSRVDVLYRAMVVPRDSMAVAIPTDIKARPGTLVNIPVLVDASAVGLTNVTSFTLAFDPSLLRFSALRTQGTASAGATVIRAQESPPGILNVTLDKTSNFSSNDTLVNLLFDTFLGTQISTELSIANETTTFGNDGCPSVLNVRTTSGVFSLDSICGLSYKTSGSVRSIQAAVYPNPAVDATSIALIVHDTTHVVITLRDALGRSVLQVYTDVMQPGTYIVPLDLRGQQAATYYVDVRTTFSSRTVPLVVRP